MPSNEGEHYSGNSSYKYINQMIGNGDKELMIVSPYISNHYTKMLLKVCGRKRIRVITSEISLGYRGSMLKNLQNKGLGEYLNAILYFAALDAIVIYLNFTYIISITTLLLILSLLFTMRRREKINKNIKLKTTGEEFVHEKLYISGSMAIVGSANLTYNGMHKNIEHIEVIRDEEEVAKLRNHFDSLWRRYP
jgi:phosphatidylserine/phosphatidylglycerophosphate/cardiolipin synthase-like enzyme